MAAFGSSDAQIQAQNWLQICSICVGASVQANLDYGLQLCSFRELAPLTRSRDRKDVALGASSSVELYNANRYARIV